MSVVVVGSPDVSSGFENYPGLFNLLEQMRRAQVDVAWLTGRELLLADADNWWADFGATVIGKGSDRSAFTTSPRRTVMRCDDSRWPSAGCSPASCRTR